MNSALGGLKTDGASRHASTPEAFARLADPGQPDEEAARQRRVGHVAGAFRRYLVDDAFGLSGATRDGTSQQAIAELARLDKEFSSDLRREQRKAFALGAALFTDGPFPYTQGAVGPRDVVTPQGVLDAASATTCASRGARQPERRCCRYAPTETAVDVRRGAFGGGASGSSGAR